MRTSNLENRVVYQFVITLKDETRETFNPQIRKPLLYLKCWGSDYPYLHGVEQQNRWLPVPMASTPSL
jgi:hypothetical protein